MPERPTDTRLRCQWCDAAGRPKATHCHACGAALPLLDDLGELMVPGVTHLDPDLESYARQPLRIPRGSPTEALAPGAVQAAAVLGGPAGVVALGTLAAVAATELSHASRRGRKVSPARLGDPSPPALELASRLQQEQAERGRETSTPAQEKAEQAAPEDGAPDL